METLSHGYLKPETPDKGPQIFPALEQNFERLNDHNHDGDNSEKLGIASVAPTIQTLAAADWVDLGNGNYRQLVTAPAGVDLDQAMINMRDSAGNILWLSIERASINTYYVYINDPTLTLKAVYTS